LRKVEQDAEIIKVRNLKPRLGYIQEQIKINENLMRDGLANRFEHLDLLKEANSIESEIDNSKVNLQRINVILEKEQTVLQGIVNDQQEQWNRELISARKMLAELTSRMDKFVDSQARTVVRAPANGTVFNLFVHNPGAVIPPGGHVLTIVPEDETMLIEAKMMVADVGYVKKGQAVRLQLANDASAGFQPVNGSVVYISADAVSEQNKPPYYLVRIRPDTPVFSNGHQTYPLVPGVVVQANVIVGERSLFKYFVNPVFQGFSSAFSER
jgi:adhesin transport system membrane fusion protein